MTLQLGKLLYGGRKAYSEKFPWFPNMQFGMDFDVT